MGDILVIQLYTHISKEAKERLREDVQRQLLDGGPVILPPYTSCTLVPDGVEVEVQDLPGGQNHFIGGEYYNGKRSGKR